MSRSRAALIVVALCLPAAALRLPTLLHAGLWRDEANVYVELCAPTFGGFLHRVAAIDYHPPLYFVLEYLWSRIAGVGEIAFQLLPFAISLATVPVVYFLGKAAGSKATGLLAAGFFTVAPLAITYSTDYLYPLAIFANTVLALQVTVARKAALTTKQFILTAGASLLAVYSHYTALIFIPLLIVWALLSPRGLRHGAVVALAVVAGALPFLLWLPVFLHQRHVGLPYHASPQPLQIVVFIVSALALLVPVPPTPIVIAAFAGVLLLPLVMLYRDSLESDSFALGVVSLCAIVLVSLAGLNKVRYVLPFCTLLYVGIAWLFVAFAVRSQHDDPAGSRRWGRPLAAALALALFVTNTAYVVADGSVPHSGIRTFMASVPVDRQTLYVVAPDYMAPDLAYYGRGKNIRLLGFARLEHPEYYVLDGYARIWNDPLIVNKALTAIESARKRYRYLVVIVDAWTHDAYEIPFNKTRELVEKLNNRYRLVSRVRYAGRWEPVVAYRFDMTANAQSRQAETGSWTQFRLNPRHDATLAGALRASWRVRTDGGYSSSPAIVGNTVYIGNNAGTLYALELQTGRVRWRYHVAASLMSNPLVWNGLVIEGEGDQRYVYNVADLSHPFKIGAGENALFAVDAATGTLRWRTTIPGTGMPTPAIINGRLIHHNGGGSILIVDPQTGRIFSSVNADGVGTMSAILPVGDERFLTIGMFGGGPWILIHARFRTTLELRSARTGNAFWTIDMPPEASGVGDCPPALAGNIAVCDYVAVGANVGPGQLATERAFGTDVETGKIAWNAALEAGRIHVWNRSAIPLVASNTAYIGSAIAPYVHALDARDGRLLWKVRVRGPVRGGIARNTDAVYFGDFAGYLWAVNAKTGRVIGSKYMREKFNVGSPVIDGQTLVIGSAGGSLIAVPLDVIRNSHDG